MERNSNSKNTSKRKGSDKVLFAGSDNPKRPTLKWFKNDNTINGLIEMRLSGENAILSKTYRLEGLSSAVMSEKVAYEIDGAVSKMTNAKGKSNMESQATREKYSEFLFHIEF